MNFICLSVFFAPTPIRPFCCQASSGSNLALNRTLDVCRWQDLLLTLPPEPAAQPK